MISKLKKMGESRAGFEGIKWADKQMQYLLSDRKFEILDSDAEVYAVNRSIHYGIFLAFEGIRFYCKKNEEGQLEIIFFNWDMNIERFRKGISFCLGQNQQYLLPSYDEFIHIFIDHYFKEPSMYAFFEEMAELGAQGYLRPFTVDEEQSIGVTFSGNPSIRAVVCRYDQYLGEPFSGVVVPNIVRAIGINKTGCLKLGNNYLMSIKAVDMAKQIFPEAASALLLDDQPHLNIRERNITEWDTSCCLFAFRDGTVVKIPESNLILPSVTIQGIVAILQEMGVTVLEQNISYGELTRQVKEKELVTVCSIGTAGILNRCQQLILVNDDNNVVATHTSDEHHEIYHKLGDAKKYYWHIYQEKVKIPAGMRLDKYVLS